jgi:hypothetical protein
MNNNPKILAPQEYFHFSKRNTAKKNSVAAAFEEIPSRISICLGISSTPRLKFLNSLFKSYLNLV